MVVPRRQGILEVQPHHRELDASGAPLARPQTIRTIGSSSVTQSRAREIRDAKLEDLSALSELCIRTFKETFFEDNEPENMALYIEKAFSIDQLTTELREDTSRFLLAFDEDHEQPVAYAKLRSDRRDPAVSGPDPIEIERLYVDQPGLGRGFGSALMEACLGAAREANHKTIWLGVWEHNPRAIAFYQRWGFETVGSHTFRLGTDDQVDLIMKRPVD